MDKRKTWSTRAIGIQTRNSFDAKSICTKFLNIYNFQDLIICSRRKTTQTEIVSNIGFSFFFLVLSVLNEI